MVMGTDAMHAASHVIYIIKGVTSVCLSVSIFRMAGQTAGPIDTKFDTHSCPPGSVSVKVNVKVIMYACRSDRITKHPERCAKATPGERCSNYVRRTGEATPGERLQNSIRTTVNYSSSNEARRRRRRAELHPEDG